MVARVNRQIALKSRPVGAPKPSDFELVERPLPSAGDGQMLCRTIYSEDPTLPAGR